MGKKRNKNKITTETTEQRNVPISDYTSSAELHGVPLGNNQLTIKTSVETSINFANVLQEIKTLKIDDNNYEDLDEELLGENIYQASQENIDKAENRKNSFTPINIDNEVVMIDENDSKAIDPAAKLIETYKSLADSTNQVNKQDQYIEAIKEYLDDIENDKKRLSTDKEQIKEIIENEESRLKEIQTEISLLETSKEETIQKQADNKDLISSNINEIRTIRKSISDQEVIKNEKIMEKEEKNLVDYFTTEILDLTKKITELEEEKSKLIMSQTENTSEIKLLIAQNIQFNDPAIMNQITIKGEISKQITEKLSNIEKILTKTSKELQESEEKLSKTNNIISALDKDLDEIKLKAEELIDKEKKLRITILETKDKAIDLQKELDEINEGLANYNEIFQEITEKITSALAKITAIEELEQTNNLEIIETESALKEGESQLNKLKEIVKTKLEEVKNLLPKTEEEANAISTSAEVNIDDEVVISNNYAVVSDIYNYISNAINDFNSLTTKMFIEALGPVIKYIGEQMNLIYDLPMKLILNTISSVDYKSPSTNQIKNDDLEVNIKEDVSNNDEINIILPPVLKNILPINNGVGFIQDFHLNKNEISITMPDFNRIGTIIYNNLGNNFSKNKEITNENTKSEKSNFSSNDFCYEVTIISSTLDGGVEIARFMHKPSYEQAKILGYKGVYLYALSSGNIIFPTFMNALDSVYNAYNGDYKALVSNAVTSSGLIALNYISNLSPEASLAIKGVVALSSAYKALSNAYSLYEEVNEAKDIAGAIAEEVLVS